MLKSDKARVRGIHYSWYGLIGLWLSVFFLIVLGERRGMTEGETETAAALILILYSVYLVGGFILGKLHNQYAASHISAYYQREDKGDRTVFHITPSPRHFPFWPIGLAGALLLITIMFMVHDGDTTAKFFTGLILVGLVLMGLQPKICLPIRSHSFEIGSGQIKAKGKTASISDIRDIYIENFMPSGAAGDTVHVVAGTPGMVAAHQATAAAGASLAELGNRYAAQMYDRSYQIEVVTRGPKMILAKGLDIYTARDILDELDRLLEGQGIVRRG